MNTAASEASRPPDSEPPRWIPINDYPGDQRFDDVPGSPGASYWGEVGTTVDGRWSWTIIACDDSANQWDAATGVVDTEEQAKQQVEQWVPSIGADGRA